MAVLFHKRGQIAHCRPSVESRVRARRVEKAVRRVCKHRAIITTLGARGGSVWAAQKPSVKDGCGWLPPTRRFFLARAG